VISTPPANMRAGSTRLIWMALASGPLKAVTRINKSVTDGSAIVNSVSNGEIRCSRLPRKDVYERIVFSYLWRFQLTLLLSKIDQLSDLASGPLDAVASTKKSAIHSMKEFKDYSRFEHTCIRPLINGRIQALSRDPPPFCAMPIFIIPSMHHAHIHHINEQKCPTPRRIGSSSRIRDVYLARRG
jgi:hypothetical protein